MLPEIATISDFGNTNPRRVEIAGVQWSRELSNVGTFSGFCRVADLRRAGLGDDLVGSFLTYAHAGAPEWGGVITGEPIREGVAEITADGWGALLGAQVVQNVDRQANGQPAGLVRRALSMTGGDVPLFVLPGTRDEGGDSASFAFGGQRVLDDVLPELADAGEVEWIVDLDRKLHVGRHIGRDLSGSVRLVEGRHFIEPDLADDLWTRQPSRVYTIESDESTAARLIRRGSVETTTVVPQRVDRQITVYVRKRHKHKARPKTIWVSDLITTTVTKLTETIALPELSSGVATWPEQAPGTSTHTLVAPNGRGLEPQTTPCQLVVMNRDNMWRRVDIGDTVRIEIGSAAFSGWFRVYVMALDTTAGTMTWSGEALPDGRSA